MVGGDRPSSLLSIISACITLPTLLDRVLTWIPYVPMWWGLWSQISNDATCGSPTWIGKGLTCVCFKRKGAYERICINLTPQQASGLATRTK
ncbi:hypothetical protein DKX38_015270 [Salix brachista]|uniref:Uncharacterized protein n=1 Tax=Salix brachista TaxID=2182728 RepID=A0A5N5L4Q9_9ROSI|nr:hypothetical protein DKX38_015270 [Salix brachista]